MNVLSLFDGMSCGRIALERAGIKVGTYFASEIDKYAIKIAKKNYPDTIHIGDVTKVTSHKLPKIDLLIGGSPCQGFSFAGKQLNFEDPRSALFFEFVRLLKECKPKYFLLENVRMKKEYQDIISKYLGVEPIKINSALVSAQNRVRYYWTNIQNIMQPEQCGEVLSDILEKDAFTANEKITHRCVMAGHANLRGNDSIKRVYHQHAKGPCLTTMGGGHREPKVYIYQRQIGKNPGGIRAVNGKTPCITSNSWQHNNHLLLDDHWRKLTPVECERLQTVDDNYTEGVSNTQRYKMIGNGWTVDVIAHIFKNVKLNEPKQMKLF